MYVYICYKPKAINWRWVNAYGDNRAAQVPTYEINYDISRTADIDYERSVDIMYIDDYLLNVFWTYNYRYTKTRRLGNKKK